LDVYRFRHGGREKSPKIRGKRGGHNGEIAAMFLVRRGEKSKNWKGGEKEEKGREEIVSLSKKTPRRVLREELWESGQELRRVKIKKRGLSSPW